MKPGGSVLHNVVTNSKRVGFAAITLCAAAGAFSSSLSSSLSSSSVAQATPKILSGADYFQSSSADTTPVAAATSAGGNGIWMVHADGVLSAAQGAKSYGDLTGVTLGAPIVGITPSVDKNGYWMLGADGGVFSYGDTHFFGSTGNMHLNAPVLQMASPDGGGYWLVASDGGIFSFGDAQFYGSTGAMTLRAPIVGMAATPDGHGYWLVASDGGIFSFGDAQFYGSAANASGGSGIVDVIATHDGGGYWILRNDGAVYAFGDAGYFGNAVGKVSGSAVSLVPSSDGAGYSIVDSSGGQTALGDATGAGAGAGSASAQTSQPVQSTSYAMEAANSAGQPVRWNPCDTISYAVVTAGAPAGWQSDVSTEISQVAAATGLHFANDGAFPSSAQVPSDTNLTISWVSTLTSGDYIGLTTFYYILDSRYTPQMTAAKIQLLSSLRPGTTGTSSEGPVLLHELGHAVGLGHVPGQPEVMNPYDQGFSTYQSGDLAGLSRLGSGQGCDGFYS